MLYSGVRRMSERREPIQIPDRPAFRSAEVCELLKVQPYVLRSWENEFSDLGVAKTPGGPRTYRRSDVERAVRIRQLVFEDGLTLAGARRQLDKERAGAPPPGEGDLDLHFAGPALDAAARERLSKVKHELRGLLAMLSGANGTAPADVATTRSSSASGPRVPEDFRLEPPSPSSAGGPTTAAEGAPRRPRKRKAEE
jgi:DNA-binding transcriptional MerR regulator